MDRQSNIATLERYRGLINKSLEDYFNSSQAEMGLKLEGHEKDALAKLKEFSLRPGKRIRGSLTLFAYEYFSGKSNPSAVNAAIATELVQNYLLIIDDVMDRSDLRRGRPTIHKLVAAELQDHDEHFANMLAVNIGLVAAHMASAVLMSVQEEPTNLNVACQIFHKNIAATGYGQIDDLYNDLLTAASEDEIIRLHELKNSYYSFIGPLQVGAALAGAASDENLRTLEAIGRPAGVAFQLRDDLLGLFGDEAKTGKSTIDDLKEGKFTLLIRYALERAPKADADKIRAALGNKDLTQTEGDEIKTIIEDCGARQAVTDKAGYFGNQAKDRVLNSDIFDEDAQRFLIDLLDFTVNRKA